MQAARSSDAEGAQPQEQQPAAGRIAALQEQLARAQALAASLCHHLEAAEANMAHLQHQLHGA